MLENDTKNLFINIAIGGLFWCIFRHRTKLMARLSLGNQNPSLYTHTHTQFNYASV